MQPKSRIIIPGQLEVAFRHWAATFCEVVWSSAASTLQLVEGKGRQLVRNKWEGISIQVLSLVFKFLSELMLQNLVAVRQIWNHCTASIYEQCLITLVKFW